VIPLGVNYIIGHYFYVFEGWQDGPQEVRLLISKKVNLVDDASVGVGNYLCP